MISDRVAGSRTAEPAVRGPGGRWPMPDRSVLATVLGLTPVAAVGSAAVLTAAGVVADLLRVGSLGSVFTVCHVVGCLLAVAWVRRDGLFGPVVAPPLLVAVAVPVVVLAAGSPPPGAGVAERLLVIGSPLVNAFPIMAWTTGLVLALGVVRLVGQRPAAERPVSERPVSERPVSERPAPPAADAAPGAARTSGSPPPS